MDCELVSGRARGRWRSRVGPTLLRLKILLKGVLRGRFQRKDQVVSRQSTEDSGLVREAPENPLNPFMGSRQWCRLTMAQTLLAQSMVEPLQELLGEGLVEEWLNPAIASAQQAEQLRVENALAINKGSLRKITKVKTQAANQWADEHAEELAAYADMQGHDYCQNVGKDLSVIKWDEQVYGAYEWPEGDFGE